jgi:hypothetical protein
MAKNFNGSKKYIGIYTLLVAIFVALLRLLGSVRTEGAEVATIKSIAVTADRKATESRLYAEQETTRLEATKLDRDIFRQYAEYQGEVVSEIKATVETQRIEQRADMKEIKDLLKNGY